MARKPTLKFRIRRGKAADIGALVNLENAVFATDRLTRRGFQRFLVSPTAVLLVAEHGGLPAGYALVLFRSNTSAARLYSLAILPSLEGKGMGSALIVASERAARARGCDELRLEVSEGNARALARYRRSGYELFGRYLDYYDDRSNALRFAKQLAAPASR